MALHGDGSRGPRSSCQGGRVGRQGAANGAPQQRTARLGPHLCLRDAETWFPGLVVYELLPRNYYPRQYELIPISFSPPLQYLRINKNEKPPTRRE